MFQLTIFAIILLFAFDITLSVLNYAHRHQPIPENVKDVYNPVEYKRWLKYTMEVFRLSIITKIVNTSFLLLLLYFKVFPLIETIANRFTLNPILQTLFFLGLYMLIQYILGIGFRIYQTFSIEERFGFNTTTVKTFVADQIKSTAISLAIGGPLLYCVLYLYTLLGASSLLYAWIIIISLTFLLNILYTKVFIRLFNKLTLLPEGELNDKVAALVTKTGYTLGKTSIMDASKRSTKLNAFFSGFGKFKHIILYDTLVEKCTSDEIISVLAHEIGHSKHKDVLKNFLMSGLQIGFYLLILSFFLSSESLTMAFGFSGIHFGFSLILFMILVEPIAIVLNIPMSYLSRLAEYRADAFAAQTGYKLTMVSALKKLARENFSNLNPHPLTVKLTYSHPTISQRIKALTDFY